MAINAVARLVKEFPNIAKRYENIGNPGEHNFLVDAITWNDLDLDRLFCRMD